MADALLTEALSAMFLGFFSEAIEHQFTGGPETLEALVNIAPESALTTFNPVNTARVSIVLTTASAVNVGKASVFVIRGKSYKVKNIEADQDGIKLISLAGA